MISFHPSWLRDAEPEKLKDKTWEKSNANLSHDSFWETIKSNHKAQYGLWSCDQRFVLGCEN